MARLPSRESPAAPSLVIPFDRLPQPSYLSTYPATLTLGLHFFSPSLQVQAPITPERVNIYIERRIVEQTISHLFHVGFRSFRNASPSQAKETVRRGLYGQR